MLSLKRLVVYFVSASFNTLVLLTRASMHLSTEAIVALVALLVASPPSVFALWKLWHRKTSRNGSEGKSISEGLDYDSEF
jgi:hypothetical protein